MNPSRKPSKRYAEYVRKIKCDEWAEAGVSGNDKGILRHIATGVTVAYGLHDGGNDWNGPRNFASEVQRICGCQLIEARGRKASRKKVSSIDPQVEAARAKHAELHAERLEREHREREEARQVEERRLASARAAQESDRREREITALMRGGGR